MGRASLLSFSLGAAWKHNPRRSFKLYTTIRSISGTNHTPIVSTNLSITRFANNGQLDIARQLFDEMPQRTVVSWNTMISGYSKWERFGEALDLFSAMHQSNVRLNEKTSSTILSVCAHSQSLLHGKEIHCLVLKSGLESFELVGSALLYFYASCSRIESAKLVFDELGDGNEVLWKLMLVGYVRCGLMSDAMDLFMQAPIRDVKAWTTIISGFVKSEDGYEKALELFRWMMKEGEVAPNQFTFDSVLRACGRLGVLLVGKHVHCLLIKCGFEFDESVGGALIRCYCECEAIGDAKLVYDRMVNPCLNTSVSYIKELMSMGRIGDAELVFDAFSIIDPSLYDLMIKEYAENGEVEESGRLFVKMPRQTIVSLNAMISIYSSNGEIDKALTLFNVLKSQRDPITWNSMISGLIQNDLHEKALRLYVKMCRLSVERIRSTFSTLFRACSSLGSLQQGQLLHSHLIKTPVEINGSLGTSLVDMYSKCGSISDAQALFVDIASPNVATSTALINGYAHHGLASEAILLFREMLKKGVRPNAATLVSVLSACCHAGLLNDGIQIFQTMERDYGVTPTVEHYTCVVDLLGRLGYLKQAEEFIAEMEIKADVIIWAALLNACWFWSDMEIAERVAEKINCFESLPKSAYVVMSNIYGGLGKWKEKTKMRKRLREMEGEKDPGCSWIEVNREVQLFYAGDTTHPHCNVIYATLDHLKANANSVFHFESTAQTGYFNAYYF